MNNAKKLFIRDIKAILHNPIALLIVLGVIILPSLYAWVNIYASWSPYSNTSTIPVAVVNLDEGAFIDDEELNVGDSVIDALEENDKIKWCFIDEEEAETGLEKGDYYASIIITEEFTKDLISVLDEEPVKPTVYYMVNTKENPVLNKITNTAQETLIEEIKSNFLMTVNETIFSSLNEVGNKLKENEREIIKFKKEIYALNSNIDFIISTLSSAEDTAVNINVFLKSIRGSLPAVTESIEVLKANNITERKLDEESKQTIVSSMETFENSMMILNSNISNLTDMTVSAATGAKDSSTLVNDMTRTNLKIAIEESINQIDNMIAYLELIKDNPGTDEEAINEQINELNELKETLNNQDDNIDSVADMNEEAFVNICDNISKTAEQTQIIADTLNKSVSSYNNEMQNDIVSLYDSKIQLSKENDEMLDETLSTIDSLDRILEVSINGTQLNADLTDSLVENLIYFKDSINMIDNTLSQFSDEEIITIISVLETDPEVMADNLTNPFEIEDEVIFPLDNYGSGMTPMYSSLAMWVGAVILTSVFSTEVINKEEASKYNSREKYLGKFLLFGLTAILQGFVLMLGNKLILDVQISNYFVFFVLGSYCSLIFSLIVYTNVSLFGDFGKAINVILLVLQIAGTGGAYPIQLDPPFFRFISPFLPFTYSLGLLREAINGILLTAVLYDVIILTLIGITFLVAGFSYKERINKFTHRFEEKFEEAGIGE